MADGQFGVAELAMGRACREMEMDWPEYRGGGAETGAGRLPLAVGGGPG